jgi:PAS domain S-box-containing protein
MEIMMSKKPQTINSDTIRHTPENDDTYHQLFIKMFDGYSLNKIIFDDHGKAINYRFLEINPAFEQMTGLKAKDIIGHTVLDVLPQTEPYWIYKFGKVAISGETIYFTKYSREFNRYFKIVAFRTQSKDVACCFSDQTDYQDMEKTIREQDERLSAMISNIGDVICIMKADGIMTYISPNCEKTSGWKPEELVGKKTWDYIHPDDIKELQNDFNELLKHDNAIKTSEYRDKQKDGTYKWIETTAVNRINDPLINGVLLNYHNITERKQAEEALEKKISTLRQPIDSVENVEFEDMFDIEDIQRLQDEFAEATGVASVITHADGRPITKPSKFCRLCSKIIRKTDKGQANCFHSDAIIGRSCKDGPIIQTCLSGGLWDAGAGITVGGKHVAN